MQKNAKKVFITAVLAVVSLSGMTLEEANIIVDSTNDFAIKQLYICEREASFIYNNPKECIKAAQLSKKEASFGIKTYGTYEKYVAVMYSNAAIIYRSKKDHSNENTMNQKALQYNPNHDTANLNLGVNYYNGEGGKVNKYKAYEHFKIAAKEGNVRAQNNLDFLCKESPWACK
ncbi:MAG: hypothetical protein WC390_00755 [Sulfurimonas sp.]